MNTNKTDVVGEYLREVEMRVASLPLLQRRELLADLESHIAAARDEGARTEGELIEVLERLGSPEVVAAAAYEENGPAQTLPPRPAGPPTYRPAPARSNHLVRWLVAGAIVLVLLCGVGFVGLFTAAGVERQAPAPNEVVVPAEPPAPR